MFFATLGFSNSQFSNWKGLYINDPFNLAEGIATVVVEGLPSIDQPKGHHFPLKTDTEDDSIFYTLKDGINLRYPEGVAHIVHVDLANNLEDVRIVLDTWSNFFLYFIYGLFVQVTCLLSGDIKNVNSILKVIYIVVI